MVFPGQSHVGFSNSVVGGMIFFPKGNIKKTHGDSGP